MIKRKQKINHLIKVLQKKSIKNLKDLAIICKNLKRNKKKTKNKAIMKLRKTQIKTKKGKFFRKISWKN